MICDEFYARTTCSTTDADGSTSVVVFASGMKKVFNCSSKSSKYPGVSRTGVDAGITMASIGSCATTN